MAEIITDGISNSWHTVRMNTPLDTLIASEMAKIELLRAKIKVCEQRIAMLRSMQSGDDDLDAALSRKVGVAQAAGGVQRAEQVQQPLAHVLESIGEAEATFPKKTLSASTLKFLRFAGTTDKSIDDFLSFATTNGIDKSRQSVRAFLHQYKTTYRLLISDRDGYFRLSDLGAAYLASIDSSEEDLTSA